MCTWNKDIHSSLSIPSMDLWKNVWRRKSVYNYRDFESVVQTCGGSPKTETMNSTDFLNGTNGSPAGRPSECPTCAKYKWCNFASGPIVFYKSPYYEDQPFNECDLMNVISSRTPQQNKSARAQTSHMPETPQNESRNGTTIN